MRRRPGDPLNRLLAAAVLALAAALAGCATSPESPLAGSSFVTFRCDDGVRFVARRVDGGNQVRVTFPNGRESLLLADPPGGQRYTDGRIVLRISGRDAFVERDGDAVFRGCRAE